MLFGRAEDSVLRVMNVQDILNFLYIDTVTSWALQDGERMQMLLRGKGHDRTGVRHAEKDTLFLCIKWCIVVLFVGQAETTAKVLFCALD